MMKGAVQKKEAVAGKSGDLGVGFSCSIKTATAGSQSVSKSPGLMGQAEKYWTHHGRASINPSLRASGEDIYKILAAILAIVLQRGALAEL